MATLFAGAAGISGVSPSVVGGTGTAGKIFTALPAAVNWNYASYSTSQTTTSAAPATINIPGNGEWEGQPFTVHAAGNLYIHGTSPTINFVLQNGTSLTATSNTTFATATATSLTTAATYPFTVSASLQGDSTSGIVQISNITMYCDGATLTSPVGTSLTGIKFATTSGTDGYPQGNSPAISIVFGVTFAVSDALNKASLMSFYADGR